MMFFFLVLAFFDLSSLRTHFWPLTLSFGKFWRAWQKSLRERGGRAFAEASAYAREAMTL
ncbi:MAG: hypothetical protein DMF39_06055 [Verrucomicrobia bacterium]|nr:MAG: hypothetical protein DMF39_06055 [Verrucomicrobiota bacterium]